MRGHHRQSPLHTSVKGVAYPITHTAVEGGEATPKRATRLPPFWKFENIADCPRCILKDGVLPGLSIQGRLQHDRGRGGVGQIFRQAYSKQKGIRRQVLETVIKPWG
jgi:hypothetical protein